MQGKPASGGLAIRRREGDDDGGSSPALSRGSPSGIRRAFAADGQTVMGRVWQQRLGHLRQDLPGAAMTAR
jgi:hypothetical protein